MATELSELVHEIQAIAGGAGRILTNWQGRLHASQVERKSAQRDLVTQADLASEEYCLTELRRRFPDDGFLAEESGQESIEAKHVWIVDPLDGTINFVHSLPMFAVSIARVTDGKPDLGVVHLPATQETFYASLQGGAWLNRTRLQVSKTAALGEALLATGFPYKRQTLLENNLENFNRFFLQVRGLRRMGSAAIDLAYTAAGRFDAFWELHLGAWDVAAGGIIIQEAGGVVDTIVSGGDWLHGKNILGGGPQLVEAVRAVLMQDRDSDYPPLGEIGKR